MNHILKSHWQEMKDAVSSHVLDWQYSETKSTYQIFALTAEIRIHYKIQKSIPRLSDQIDFEDNIKGTAKRW